jgi:hypothetical protein
MNRRALTTIEIEALTPSTLTVPHERREPVSLDGGDYPSKSETRRRATLRWFVDTLALAGDGMAGVYVGVWLDQPNVPSNQTGRKDETSPRQRGVAAARHDADRWPFV